VSSLSFSNADRLDLAALFNRPAVDQLHNNRKASAAIGGAARKSLVASCSMEIEVNP